MKLYELSAKCMKYPNFQDGRHLQFWSLFFKFYGSDIPNYPKNGYFDPNNVYIDGSSLFISIIL